MLLWRATAALGVVMLLSANCADAAADNKRRKKKGGGLLGRVFRNVDSVKDGDEPLTEDEGYWERFLQATVDSIPSASPSAPPTPGPLCDVTVELTCQDTNGVECQEIPRPEPDEPEDCMVDVVYDYCVFNSGDVTQRVIKLESTRDGTTTDLTGMLETTTLEAGDKECVKETETIDICQGTKFMTTAAVESTTVGSSPKLCEDRDMYMFTPEVPCKTEVDITCVDSEGNECQLTPEPLSPEECIEPFTYTYTIENVGPTCMELNTWEATFITETPEGEQTATVLDLLPKVPEDERNICPGETFSVQETIDTDLCSGNIYKTTTEIEANPPNGNSCQATDEYTVIPTAPCKTEVDITCEINGEDCNLVQKPDSPEDCIQDATYCYTITNVGATCMLITTFERTREIGGQVQVDELINEIASSDRNLCPGDNPIEVCEVEATDLCSGFTYKTTAIVEANPPNGKTCQGTDEYTFTPGADCAVAVDITCVDSSGFDCVDTLPPVDKDDCDETFTYTYTIRNIGPTCMDIETFTRTISDGETEQERSLFPLLDVTELCPDDPSSTSVSEEVVVNICEGKEYKTTSMVTANPPEGETCEGSAEYIVKPEAPCATDTTITCVDSNGNDCRDTPEPENPEDCIEDFTYTYTVENIGATCMTVTSWTRDRNGEVENLLVNVNEDDRVVCPGETLTYTEVEPTDLCAGETYTTTTEINANPPNGNSCQATDEYIVEPKAPCKVLVEIACTNEDGNDCKDTPEPEKPEDCEEDMTYCYTLTNVGATCMDISLFVRDRNGETADLSSLLNGVTKICPDDDPIEICEEPETTDLCVGETYETCVEVEADPPNGDGCQSTDCYEFTIEAPCDVEIDITCTNEDGVACEEIEEPDVCIQDLTYTYCIDNPGPTCMTVTDFVRTITPPGDEASILDLLENQFGSTTICPEDTDDGCIGITETVSTNVCTNQPVRVTTRISAQPPLGDGCEASDEYFFLTPTPPPTPNPTLPPTPAPTPAPTPPPTPAPTPLPTPGPTPPPTPAPTPAPTPPPTPAPTPPPTPAPTPPPTPAPTPPPTPAPTPPPTPAPTPPPSPAPTPADECDVVVRTECSTQAATIGGSGECDAIIPIITRCEQRATFMEMLFNGGDCSQSFNIQEADKFDCTDQNGGPANTGQYWIHVVPKKDPTGDVYFSGFVNVGDVFPMCPGYPQCSGDRFEADSTVYVFPDNPGNNPTSNPNWAQLVNFHSSCSQNLFLKDKYGSTQLVIFFNEEQGLVSCFITATFSIVLTNEGEASADEIILFTNTVNGNTTDLTDAVQGVQPGEQIIITTQILIDMTVRQDYIVTTDIIGATERGKQCSDSYTFTFTAGNNLDSPPGIINPESF